MSEIEIGQAVDDYLTRCRVERGLSPNTLEAYSRDLRGFNEFCGRYGAVHLTDIDRLVVRRHIASLSTRGYAPRTLARKASSVRAFLEDSARRGLTESNPAAGVPRPKQPRSLPRPVPSVALSVAKAAFPPDGQGWPLPLTGR